MTITAAASTTHETTPTQHADSHEPIRGQRIWLVGASSGIGAALANELLRRGGHIAISARREEELAEVSQGRMSVAPLDVTDQDAVRTAVSRVREDLGGLDMVIWCAGYWKQFTARDWKHDEFLRTVEVNLLGLNNVLAETLPDFVAAGSGHIVGIASVAGYRGITGSEAYGATKAAQINLLEAMRTSLNDTGVRVTTVCPGFVATEMTESNTFPMPFIIEPEEAATDIANGLQKRRNEIIFPLPMALLMKAARFVPVAAWAKIFGRRRKDERNA